MLLGGSAVLTPERASDVAFWVDLHQQGFGLGLLFFGLACVLYGILAYRSGFLPRTIGVLVAVAGASYLIKSLTMFLVPSWSPAVVPLLALSLVGELSFSGWLLFRGIRPRT